MLIFSTTPIISILFALSGIISSNARPTNSPSSAPTTDIVWIQENTHTPAPCTPSLQADEVNILRDTACVLEDFGSFTLSGINTNCSRVFSDNGFPGLYRALTETLSEFERTDLAVQNFSESVCSLKRFVIPEINRTVNNYCSCSNSVHCTALDVSSEGDDVSSANNEDGNNPNEECLLLNLKLMLRRIQRKLGGRNVVCKRTSNVQWKLLTDFQTAIERYYDDVISSVWIELGSLPRSPCRYRPGRSQNLTSHVRSLYTIAPYLSSLNATEPQQLSGNISEIILPVIGQLLGEDYVETAINTSMPFSISEEAKLEALSEDQRTVCLITRLKLIKDKFMKALRDENIIRDPCV